MTEITQYRLPVGNIVEVSEITQYTLPVKNVVEVSSVNSRWDVD